MTARGAAFIIGEMTFPSRFTAPALPDHRSCWTTLALVVMLSTPGAFASILDSANASGSFGLYPAGNFRITTGACTDCPTLRQALWYFRAETIAIPRTGMPVAAWTPGVHAYDDILQWAGTRPVDAAIDYPPLVWIAAPEVAQHARMSADGRVLMTLDGALPFRPVAKIPLNRSYYDASSVAWFGDRALTVRGTSTPEGFIARSFWPDAWAFGPGTPTMRAVPMAGSEGEALRMLMREEPRGGAQSPYQASMLWQRNGVDPSLAGRTVLGFMVNGAQGDDDEAHGGHFALVTGRVQSDGSIGDWLVNNFYSLDVESEKGIIAAPLPLDNYLADLNSGQGWYRPTTIVVAVLRDERAAVLVQSALNRVYNQFYRHQLEYYHPSDNCTSISVDTLRALGWNVPVRGPTSKILAWLGFPWVALKELSLDKAKVAFDYLYTDQTRLMPAAALEEIFGSLIAMSRGQPTPAQGSLGTMLAEDLEGLAFLRFPQFPSSRRFGNAPAVTTWEYEKLIPKNPALRQIVPVPPRPFPEELRDPDLLRRAWRPSDTALVVWSLFTVVGAPFAVWRVWKWRRSRRGAPA